MYLTHIQVDIMNLVLKPKFNYEQAKQKVKHFLFNFRKILKLFPEFDKENYVLYEFVNREWIKFCMYNKLNEQYMGYVEIWRGE